MVPGRQSKEDVVGGHTGLGASPRDPAQKLWDPEMQALPPEARRRLQGERTRALVQRALSVPFFAKKLRDAGITHAEDVRGAQDLSRIPLTRKQELRDSEALHPPIGDYRFTGLCECVRISQSTGTTGVPTTTIFTRKDLWIEYESSARALWRRGHRPGMIATHAHPAYLYGGGALVSATYEYFGLVNLWVPPPDTDDLAEVGLRAWMRFKPDIPFQGFSLGRYLEVAAKLGLDPVKDLGMPASRGGAAARMPLVTAGLECYSYLGGVCGKSAGAHLNEDWAVVQAVDPSTGKDVPDGEWGTLVVTTLDRDNGLIRYDLEEACALDREPCPCGETSARGFWGGRFRDLLSCQGRRFQAWDIERALRNVDAVTKPSLEWLVVRPTDPSARLALKVELESGEAAAVAQLCEARIREGLGVDARVEIVARGALPRSGYKATRIVDAPP
jgi:phenylacetate-CoA ligase